MSPQGSDSLSLCIIFPPSLSQSHYPSSAQSPPPPHRSSHSHVVTSPRLSALDSIAVDHEYYDRPPPNQPDPRADPDACQDQQQEQSDEEVHPVARRARRTTNQVTWAEDLQQHDRPNRDPGSSSAMAIDLEQYQAPNPTHGYHDALLSALEDLSSGKSGAAACDQKKYLKTRYQPALQDLSPASLSRQLAHLLIEVNFNALMPVDYHFKGPHSYMNSYSDTITTFQRLQNTLTYQKVDVMIPAALAQVITFTTAQQNRGTPWAVTKLRLLQRFDLYCHDLDLNHLTRASENEEDRAFEVAGPSSASGATSQNQLKTTKTKANRMAWQQQRQGLDKQAPPIKKPRIEELPPDQQCKYHLELWAKTNQTDKKCTHTIDDCTAFKKFMPAARQAYLESGIWPQGKR